MGASQPISEYIGELLEDSGMSASQTIGGLEIRIQIIFSQPDKKDNRSGFCLVDFASGLSAIYIWWDHIEISLFLEEGCSPHLII